MIAPPLDGTLVVDEAAREAVATDQGNLVHQTPSAVLRPGSARDIGVMIGYCGARGIPVAARGQGHSMFGAARSSGLVIENRHLNRIHSIGPDVADVDTGVQWKDLVTAAFAHGLTPPVLTGYTALSVGGTLAVGGVGGHVGGVHTGLQVDHVRRFEVVTGTGQLLDCSPGHELFNAVLAGLGQFGVMTRATVELIPAKERARLYLLHYRDSATAFRDLRTLRDRPGFDHVHLRCIPQGGYELSAAVFYDFASPPDDSRLTGGLGAAPAIEDTGYLEYAFRGDKLLDTARATLGWDRFIKPWFNVWLPESAVEPFVAEVVPTLTQRDVGTTGSILVLPLRRSRLTRPFLRLPEPDGSDWVYAFNILAAADPGPIDAEQLLARNTTLFHKARNDFGGVLYPIGAVPLTRDDWKVHYGQQWEPFVEAKHRFDPNGILAPGVGIFSA